MNSQLTLRDYIELTNHIRALGLMAKSQRKLEKQYRVRAIGGPAKNINDFFQKARSPDAWTALMYQKRADKLCEEMFDKMGTLKCDDVEALDAFLLTSGRTLKMVRAKIISELEMPASEVDALKLDEFVRFGVGLDEEEFGLKPPRKRLLIVEKLHKKTGCWRKTKTLMKDEYGVELDDWKQWAYRQRKTRP